MQSSITVKLDDQMSNVLSWAKDRHEREKAKVRADYQQTEALLLYVEAALGFCPYFYFKDTDIWVVIFGLDGFTIEVSPSAFISSDGDILNDKHFEALVSVLKYQRRVVYGKDQEEE